MKRQFAAVLVAATSLIAVLAAPVTAHAPRVHAASSYRILLKDSYFTPANITTRGSATLSFVYVGKLTHNIIGPKVPGSYATPHKRAKTLTRTYTRGSYRFDCSIHPGMVLKLRVR